MTIVKLITGEIIIGKEIENNYLEYPLHMIINSDINFIPYDFNLSNIIYQKKYFDGKYIIEKYKVKNETIINSYNEAIKKIKDEYSDYIHKG